MSNSNQIREYRLDPDGVTLREMYLGPEGMLTGLARVAQESPAAARALELRQDNERRRRQIERKRHAVERQIAEMRAELDVEAAEAEARDELEAAALQ